MPQKQKGPFVSGLWMATCQAPQRRGLDIRAVDLDSLCRAEHPSQIWSDLSIAEQAHLLRQALAPKRTLLLDPGSPYMRAWDLSLLVALMYCAVVTPFEVAFLKSPSTAKEAFVSLMFWVDRFVDALFLKDMVMQFFLMVQVVDKHGNQRWLRNRKQLALRYCKGWFIPDLLSVAPLWLAGFLMQSTRLQSLKIMRVVRILRLLKLARVLRATRLMGRWAERLSTIPYSKQALLRFLLILIVLSHWMACIWGLIGLFLGANLICEDDGSKWGMPRVTTVEQNPSGYSWILKKSWEPDSPCNPFHVYAASLHFAIMTITSIGYGDITPTRFEEYFVGVFCQLGGGITWAYVIGAACGVLAKANPQKNMFEQIMDALNRMLNQNQVETGVRVRAREFLREARHHNFLLGMQDLTSIFSHELRAELTEELATGTALRQIKYLEDAPPMCVQEIAQQFEPYMMAAHEVCDLLLGRLCVLERGAVARAGRVLVPVMVWGEDLVLTREDLQLEETVVTLAHSEILTVTRDRLLEVVHDYPVVDKRIRWWAAKLATRRTLLKVARERRRGKIENTDLDQIVKDAEQVHARRARHKHQLRRSGSGSYRSMREGLSRHDVTLLEEFEDLERLVMQGMNRTANNPRALALHQQSGVGTSSSLELALPSLETSAAVSPARPGAGEVEELQRQLEFLSEQLQTMQQRVVEAEWDLDGEDVPPRESDPCLAPIGHNVVKTMQLARPSDPIGVLDLEADRTIPDSKDTPCAVWCPADSLRSI